MVTVDVEICTASANVVVAGNKSDAVVPNVRVLVQRHKWKRRVVRGKFDAPGSDNSYNLYWILIVRVRLLCTFEGMERAVFGHLRLVKIVFDVVVGRQGLHSALWPYDANLTCALRLLWPERWPPAWVTLLGAFHTFHLPATHLTDLILVLLSVTGPRSCPANISEFYSDDNDY